MLLASISRREDGEIMKQVAQNYRSGELAVLDVPAPSGAPGGVLVRSLYSLISTGTELMKVGESKMSLIGKARAASGPAQEGARHRVPAGPAHRLQESHEPPRLLHAPRVFAGRGRGRRGGGGRGILAGPDRGLRGERVRLPRRVQLGAEEPVRGGSRCGGPSPGRLRHRGGHRHAGCASGRRSDR